LRGNANSSGEFRTGLATDKDNVGLVEELDIVTGWMDVLGWLYGETDCLCCAPWFSMTVLKFKPLWKGVEVVKWFEEAR